CGLVQQKEIAPDQWTDRNHKQRCRSHRQQPSFAPPSLVRILSAPARAGKLPKQRTFLPHCFVRVNIDLCRNRRLWRMPAPVYRLPAIGSSACLLRCILPYSKAPGELTGRPCTCDSPDSKRTLLGKGEGNMKAVPFGLLVLVVAVSLAAFPPGPAWRMKADYVEACSCHLF